MSEKRKLTFTNKLKDSNLAEIIWFTYDTPVNAFDKAEPKQVINNII